jgi:hypothetical protein
MQPALLEPSPILRRCSSVSLLPLSATEMLSRAFSRLSGVMSLACRFVALDRADIFALTSSVLATLSLRLRQVILHEFEQNLALRFRYALPH